MKILTTKHKFCSIDCTIKQLEKDLESANSNVIKTAKRCNYKLIGRFFRNRLQTEKTFRDLIWYELRDLLRKKRPELFIGGDY